MSLDDLLTLKAIKSGVYTTSRGQLQEGVAFVCLTHGLQAFHCMFKGMPKVPEFENPSLQLECGCVFEVYKNGSVRRKRT